MTHKGQLHFDGMFFEVWNVVAKNSGAATLQFPREVHIDLHCSCRRHELFGFGQENRIDRFPVNWCDQHDGTNIPVFRSCETRPDAITTERVAGVGRDACKQLVVRGFFKPISTEA